MPGSPHVESVNPTDLAGVHAMFRRVGDLLGAREAAEALIAAFEATAAEIARAALGGHARGSCCSNGSTRPSPRGHWNPELIALAGGAEVIGRPGEPSRRLSWEEVAAADPEVILLSPCGFTLDRTEAECRRSLRARSGRPAGGPRGGVALVDGSAYFSRPGPRLEASLRIAAAAIDPESCGDLAPRASGWRRLGHSRLES